MALSSYLVVVEKPGDMESLKKAFIDLADTDADFSGENGDDYLRDEVREAGYESNAEYYAEKVIKEGIENGQTQVQMLENYLGVWIGGDSYYKEYDYTWQTDGDDLKAVAVAISY